MIPFFAPLLILGWRLQRGTLLTAENIKKKNTPLLIDSLFSLDKFYIFKV
jgi:hypothetical protein